MRLWVRCSLVGVPTLAVAGPPYISDDPEPTDSGHYEIYFFGSGAGSAQGVDIARGIDFNYGPAQDIQLTATVPVEQQRASDGGGASWGLSNIELAVKYRFLHQADGGWDVAVFPRLFLPSASKGVGTQHASLLIPVWVEKDWENGWSTFGGGGCEWNRGNDSKNFCLAGWTVTRQVLRSVQLGVEVVHQTADSRNGHVSTNVGGGLKYDLNERWHFLAYTGFGLRNIAPNERYNWYASVLLSL